MPHAIHRTCSPFAVSVLPMHTRQKLQGDLAASLDASSAATGSKAAALACRLAVAWADITHKSPGCCKRKREKKQGNWVARRQGRPLHMVELVPLVSSPWSFGPGGGSAASLFSAVSQFLPQTDRFSITCAASLGLEPTHCRFRSNMSACFLSSSRVSRSGP